MGKKSAKPILLALAIILCLILWPGSSWGQEPNLEGVLITAPTTPKADQVLEKSIDPAEYVLGAGDELSIDVWGQTGVHQTLTVTPEGDILIPGVGSIQVGGKHLAEAKELIKQAVSGSYRTTQVTVTLLKLKKIKASVVGAVKTPGVYPVYANTRVSEMIEEADGFLDGSSRRNIKVTHLDGSTGVADIFRFERIGDQSKNPYVLAGDVIFVPLRDERVNTVGVYGAVKSEGAFEYAPHDSLMDLIRLAYGLTMDVDLLKAELVRFNPDDLTTRNLPVDLEGLLR